MIFYKTLNRYCFVSHNSRDHFFTKFLSWRKFSWFAVIKLHIQGTKALKIWWFQQRLNTFTCNEDWAEIKSFSEQNHWGHTIVLALYLKYTFLTLVKSLLSHLITFFISYTSRLCNFAFWSSRFQLYQLDPSSIIIL